MSEGNITKLLFPIDPVTGALALELMCVVPSESELSLFCKDLEGLGYRFVILPIQTLYNISEFREVWREYIANKTLANIACAKGKK